MDAVQKNMLGKIAGISDFPTCAYNVRVDGCSIGANSTPGVTISAKENGTGINIHVAKGVKNETVYIPVIISESGLEETVYNDFYIGDGADVKILAGCGVHNSGDEKSRHDGVHSFHVGRNARISYVEKHYGEGDGNGERILNPVTHINLETGAYMEVDTVQIEGVDSTKRDTVAQIGDGATLVIKEKLMTHGKQYAKTAFTVHLNGKGAGAHVVSRSVAKGESKQIFLSNINGNNECSGHSECDAIIMDGASVQAIPEISANHTDASLVHEAAIGKIAGEQIIKLRTLGLSEEQAILEIINGFLK